MIYIDLSSRLYKSCWLLVSIGHTCLGLQPRLPTPYYRAICSCMVPYMRTCVSKCFTEEFYITVTLVAVYLDSWTTCEMCVPDIVYFSYVSTVFLI